MSMGRTDIGIAEYAGIDDYIVDLQVWECCELSYECLCQLATTPVQGCRFWSANMGKTQRFRGRESRTEK